MKTQNLLILLFFFISICYPLDLCNCKYSTSWIKVYYDSANYLRPVANICQRYARMTCSHISPCTLDNIPNFAKTCGKADVIVSPDPSGKITLKLVADFLATIDYTIYVNGLTYSSGSLGSSQTKIVSIDGLDPSCNYLLYSYKTGSSWGHDVIGIYLEKQSCRSSSTNSCPDEDTIINAFFQKITTIKDTDVCGGSMRFSYSKSGKTYTFAAYYNYGYDKLTIKPVNSEALNCFSQPIVVNNVKNSVYLPSGTTFDYCPDKFLQALKDKNIQCCGDPVDYIEINGNSFGVTVNGYKYSINNYPVVFTCGDIGIPDCGDCNENSAAQRFKDELKSKFENIHNYELSYKGNTVWIYFEGITTKFTALAGDYDSVSVNYISLYDILEKISDYAEQNLGERFGFSQGNLKNIEIPYVGSYELKCDGYSINTFKCKFIFDVYGKCTKSTNGVSYELKLANEEYYVISYEVDFTFGENPEDVGEGDSGGGGGESPPPPPCEPSSVSASISGCPSSVNVGDPPVTLRGSPSGISNSWSYSGPADFQESGTTLTISNFQKKGTVTAQYSVIDDDGCGGTTSDSDTCTFNIKGLVPKIKYSVQPTSPNCGDQVNITVEVYDDKYGLITSSRSDFPADVTILPSVYDNLGTCGVKGNNPCWFTINTNKYTDSYSTIVYALLDPDDPDAWEFTQVSQLILFNCSGAICISDAYISPVSPLINCGSNTEFKGVCGRVVNGVIQPMLANIAIFKNGNIIKTCTNTTECMFSDVLNSGGLVNYSIKCNYYSDCPDVERSFVYTCLNPTIINDSKIYVSDIKCFDNNGYQLNCTKVYRNDMVPSCNGVDYPILNYINCYDYNISKFNCSLTVINLMNTNKTVKITFMNKSKTVTLSPCYNVVNFKNDVSLSPGNLRNFLVEIKDQNGNYINVLNIHMLNSPNITIDKLSKVKTINEYENYKYFILLIVFVIIIILYLKLGGNKNEKRSNIN